MARGRQREEQGSLPAVQQRLERLAGSLERMHLAEYAALYDRPYRLLFFNFAAGVARGLGTGLGFALVSALLVYVLQSALLRNLPLVGDFLADIVRLVQFNLRVAR